MFYYNDFNARSTKWWKLDKENFEGPEVNIITRAVGYSQVINQSTHITKDSLSCIDLMFTSNSNLINRYGVETSLFQKCRHNIVYGKIDFKIPIAPPYMREVWHYKNASAESNVLFLVLTGTFYSGENMSSKRLTY